MFGAAALVLAAATEVPNYSYWDAEKGDFAGIDIDIARAAAKKLGRPLEVKSMPFGEILPYLKAGKAHFAAGTITITEGRARDVDFSIPYAIEGASFLYRKGGKVPTMITGETMRIGVVDSMTHDFYLARHGIDPFRFTKYKQAVEALEAGKVDAVFYEKSGVEQSAALSGGRLVATPLEMREFYGIAVAKGDRKLLEAVNEAIRERGK